MNWIKKLSQYNMGDVYYTVVDPADFYEWKFSGTIPKGTRFTKRMPPSESFTTGQMVAASRINSHLKEDNGIFQTTEDVKSDIHLHAGNVLSPSDVAKKYIDMVHQFQKEVESFKERVLIEKYAVMGHDPACLYKFEDRGDTAVLYNFGPLSEARKKFSVVQKSLMADAMKKKGRSYELENFRRFENFLTLIDNKEVPVNYSVIDNAIKLSGIKPEKEDKLSWTSCYIKLSEEAKTNYEKIQTLSSIKWLKHAVNLMGKGFNRNEPRNPLHL